MLILENDFALKYKLLRKSTLIISTKHLSRDAYPGAVRTTFSKSDSSRQRMATEALFIVYQTLNCCCLTAMKREQRRTGTALADLKINYFLPP